MLYFLNQLLHISKVQNLYEILKDKNESEMLTHFTLFHLMLIFLFEKGTIVNKSTLSKYLDFFLFLIKRIS